MPLGKEGHIGLDQIVDNDGNPARVSLIAGVYRLAVDALLVGPAGAYAQGNFDSVAVDEANALAMWVRAAVTALDTSQAVGSQNVPVSARPFNTPLGTQVAGTLEGLTTNARIAGYRLGATEWGAVYSDAPSQASGTAIGNFVGLYTNAMLCAVRSSVVTLLDSSAALGAQAYTRERLLTDSVLRGDDGATYSAIAARNADLDADFTNTLIGILTNSRNSFIRGASDNWVRMSGDFPATINSESSSGFFWARMASAIYGRDTSDSTMRAIEARISADTLAASLYRLLTFASVYGIDAAGAGTVPSAIYSDTPSSFPNGRGHSSERGLWTNSLDVKYDVAGAVLIPTSTERTATGSVVNPAAAATIATLDARGLTNKSFAVTDTAIGTYTIRFSHDGVTYRSPAEFAGIATVVGTVMASNRAIEVMRGYRYIQIGATEVAGTVTVEITAQGA